MPLRDQFVDPSIRTLDDGIPADTGFAPLGYVIGREIFPPRNPDPSFLGGGVFGETGLVDRNHPLDVGDPGRSGGGSSEIKEIRNRELLLIGKRGVENISSRRQGVAYSLQKTHLAKRRHAATSTTHSRSVLGIRSIDNQTFELGSVERQQGSLVLEKDDRFGCNLRSNGGIFRRIKRQILSLLFPVGKSHGNRHPQLATHRIVDSLLRQLS